MMFPNVTIVRDEATSARFATGAERTVRVRAVSGLRRGFVRGRPYAHNPRGYESLVVLSEVASRVLDVLAIPSDEPRSLRELSALTGVLAHEINAELDVLARNELVSGEGLAPPKRPPPSRRSFDLWVHVTNACNLDCGYCYIEKDGRSLDESQIDATIDALVATARGGVQRIQLRLAGGEPLLRMDLVRSIVTRARVALDRVGCALDVSILSNGTAVTPEIAAWLARERVAISLSIDGVGVVQDRLRPALGGGRSWPLLTEGLASLRREGVRPYVLVTVGDSNLDGLPALTDWLIDESLGFRYSLVRDLDEGRSLIEHRSPGWSELVTLRRSSKHSGSTRSKPPVLEGAMLERVIDTFDECYARIERRAPIRPSFRKTHRFCDLEWRRPIRKACGAGTSSLALGHDGRLSACQASLSDADQPALDRATSLVAQARASRSLSVLEGRVARGPCETCEIRHSCAGGCPLYLLRRDGELHGQSPYCAVFEHVLPKIIELAALELSLEQEARSP